MGTIPLSSINSDSMSCPSELAVDEHAFNAGETAFLEDLYVGRSVLSSDGADPAQAASMKLFEMLTVSALWGPCFTVTAVN